MDLNFQYSEHQQSLMLAMTSTNCAHRMRHLESAGSVAKRIHAWQHAQGADAATAWSLVIDGADQADFSNQRIPA